MSKHAIVIGAGLAGLASACLLARRGYNVTVIEKNSTPGGKMQEFHKDSYRFDTGPSLFTMPFILKRLFEECGEQFDDHLELTEPEPLCRYFFPDGTIFNNYAERDRSMAEIKKFAPEDREAYARFLDYSEGLYDKTADAFLFNTLFSLKDLKHVKWSDFLKIDAFSTVSDKVDDYFQSDYLRKFFKRFTTYNGSSPFQAPATLNVIPHVELNMGGYYVKGGMYRIAESLYDLGKSLGVTFRFEAAVKEITVTAKKATGVKLINGESISSDLVFANSDATDTLLNLLPENAVSARKKRKQQALEPSCSGFVLMLGCNRSWDELAHHNIFFSEDYQAEFDQIFNQKKLPDDPTIYVANTSYTDPDHAPGNGSNLFILVNSPYLAEGQDWNVLQKTYPDQLLDKLERSGLSGLKDSIDCSNVITPENFEKLYRSNKGSIYGTSSNSRFAAFLRPRNRLKSIQNLYLVGGSTHPGGGIPLVIQSAFHATDLLDRNG
jgi:phytoene desaturase